MYKDLADIKILISKFSFFPGILVLHFIKTRCACEQVILAPLDPLLAAGVDLHAAGLALHRLAALVPLTAHVTEHDVAAVPRLLESAFVFSVQVGSSELYHGILCIFNAV